MYAAAPIFLQEKMNRVLAVRYTDLELEKTLCLEILALAEQHSNHYAGAFAYTYLGDYYVTVSDYDTGEQHLLTALRISEKEGFENLLIRIHTFLGLCYAIQDKEQASMQHYATGLAFARRLGESVAESLLLNNIAFIFHRHQGYEQALSYYEEAYRLIRTLPEDDSGQHLLVLGNLIEILIILNRTEDVPPYIRLCEELDCPPEEKDIFFSYSWCCYYAAIGNTEKALYWADHIISQKEPINTQTMRAFSFYIVLCMSMLKLGIKDYTYIFLSLAGEVCDDRALNYLQELESLRISVYLRFEPEEAHYEVYHRYYTVTRKLSERANQQIVSGIKSQIRLYTVSTQNSGLQARRDTLANEANVDELTGLYNRRYFQGLLNEIEHKPIHANLGFIMIDVDCLKEYNDFYGHPQGDKLLATVGGILRTHAPEGLYACRFGGDEFVCFCRDVSDSAIDAYISAVQAALYTENIPHAVSPVSGMATLSIGCASAATPGLPPVSQLQQTADDALYQSKLRGRNTSTRLVAEA